MKYFLGIDVGSSKTHAVIACETGECIGFGRAGGGNHQGVGYEGFEKALQVSFGDALNMARVKREDIAGAGFGVAGYDFPSDRPGHLDAIAHLGLSCPSEIVNDGMIGLLAGATNGVGVNVTSGSSNNCRGRNPQGMVGRIVGNGPMFGEYGGAMEIMLRGLQMVNHAWIKRISATALTDVFLRATGASNEMDLMEGLSKDRYHLHPGIAIDIIAAARAGDASAEQVIEWAGEELGWLAVAVARQIEMDDKDVEIIQSGSVFEAGEMISAPMRRIIMEHMPRAALIRLDGPPVIGAVILGMEQAGHNGYAVRHNLVKSAKQIVQ